MTSAQLLAVFNARTDTGSGFRDASRNPYLWGALAITTLLEAVALGIGPLRELLGLAVLSPAVWVVAVGLAIVPVVLTQFVRMWRERRSRSGDAGGADREVGSR